MYIGVLVVTDVYIFELSTPGLLEGREECQAAPHAELAVEVLHFCRFMLCLLLLLVVVVVRSLVKWRSWYNMLITDHVNIS